MSAERSIAQTLKYNEEVTANNQERVVRRSFEIYIPSQKYAYLNEVRIFSSGESEFRLERAELYDLYGNRIRKLKNKELKSRNAFDRISFHTDDLIYYFKLAHPRYPQILKYSYEETQEEFFNLTFWSPESFQGFDSVSASLTITVPSDYKVNKLQSGTLDYTKENDAERIIYKWSASAKPNQNPSEDFERVIENGAFVLANPDEFIYGNAGKSSSWKEYGNWLSSLNEGMDRIISTELNNVRRQVDTTGLSKKEIAKALYYYMQDHTRYVSMSFEQGGIEPFPASYVCSKRYGDCKALTLYMKGLLSEYGINSYYTLVRAGSSAAKVRTEIPNMLFNHVILTVPIAGDTIFLENTSNVNPFGYLGTFTQNRKALLVDTDMTSIIELPTLSTKDSFESREYRFHIDDRGSGTVSVKVNAGGETFENINGLNRSGDIDNLEEFMGKFLPEGSDSEFRYHINDDNRDSSFTEFEVMAKCARQVRTIGDILVLNQPLIELPEPAITEKTEGFKFLRFPTNRANTVLVDLENLSEWEVKLPADFKMVNTAGGYEVNFQLQGNVISMTENFFLLSGNYEGERLGEYLKLIEESNKKQKELKIILKSKNP